MTKKKKNLEALINNLPDCSELGSGDIKALAINFILDQEDDSVEESRGTRSRLRLEALRLLHDIVKSEQGGDLNSAILAVIQGKED